MTVVPVLAAVFKAQKENKLCTWLGECYIGEEKLVSRALCWRGLIYEAHRAHSKISPSLFWSNSTAKKGGLFLGGYGTYKGHMLPFLKT